MATSSGFKIFIVIVMSLAIWHFGAPYLGVPSWLDYISDYTSEDVPADIYYEFSFYDTITSQDRDLIPISDETDNDLELAYVNAVEADCTLDTWCTNVALNDIPTLEIVIKTNAPASFLPPQYKVKITGSENWYDIWSLNYKSVPHTFASWTINSGSGDKEYRYTLDPEDCELAGTFAGWTFFRMQVINPSDVVVWQDTLLIW